MDTAQAERFIAALTGNQATPVTFQTFDDTDKKRKSLAVVLHGTLHEHADRLDALNEQGSGVFVTVNATDLTGRKASNVQRVRALFADNDGGNFDPWDFLPVPEPTLVVQSANGQHAYWLVRDCALEQFSDAQKRIAKALGTDSTVHDLPRVMRLPGSTHHKGAPFAVTICEETQARYTFAQVLAEVPELPRLVPTPHAKPTPRQATGKRADKEERARLWLDKRDLPSKGERNTLAYSTACNLVQDFDLGTGQALALLEAWNQRLADPLDQKELAATVEHAAKYATQPKGGKLRDIWQPEALERLAVAYKQQAPEWDQALEVARKQGAIKALKKRVITKAHEQEGIPEIGQQAGRSIIEAIEGAPVPPDAAIPDGYTLTLDGVYRLTTRKVDGVEVQDVVQVASNPLVVSGWVPVEHTGTKMLEIAWLAAGKWHRRIVPREQLSSTQAIIPALSAYGCPVTSVNGLEVVRYIDAYQQANLPDAIPVRHYTTQLGWQHTGGFVLGRQHFGTGDLVFQGDDGGDEILASRYQSAGSMGVWAQALEPISDWPKVELGLYASLAAPLLHVVRGHGFIIDYSGGSTTGKTSALCIAASIWGVPDERDAQSLITSWDTTEVALERMAALANSLPLFVDETKRAKAVGGVSVVPQMAYALANGQGRARGTRSGVSAVRHWRTITLTTGEQSIVDMSRDAGLRARVLTLWGSPMGGHDPRVDDVLGGILGNYGVAGAVWAEYLAGLDVAAVDELRARYSQLQSIYTAVLERNAAGRSAGRLAKPLAVLELAAELARPILGLGWHYSSPMAKLAPEIAKTGREVDTTGEALDDFFSTCVGHAGSFAGQRMAANDPPGGWAGKWETGGPPIVIATVARDWLTKLGYDARATIKHWAANGTIIPSSTGREEQTTRIDGKMCRVLIFAQNETNEMQNVTNVTRM